MSASTLLAALCAAVGALTVITPASAQPPSTGTGTGTIEVRSTTPVRSAGGNAIQERDLAGTVDGSLVGTFVEHVVGVIHSSGSVTFHGTMTFTGSIEGCGTGTFKLGVSGKGVVGAPVTESNIWAMDSTENTLAVHGVGSVRQVGTSLTYEVHYLC